MGEHPYWYFTPYQADLNAALQHLRQQEFEAGRYSPVNPFPFDPALNEPIKAREPNAGHYASIEAALEAAMAAGTRSILDIKRVADDPGLSVASPVATPYLWLFFRTDKPKRQVIEAVLFGALQTEAEEEEDSDYDAEIDDFFALVDRGESEYVIVYADEQPAEIFFAGYSFD